MLKSLNHAMTSCPPNLCEAIQKADANGLYLSSGATHDASAMADLCPDRDAVCQVPRRGQPQTRRIHFGS